MTSFGEIFHSVVIGQELGSAVAMEAFSRQDSIYDVGDAAGWCIQFANGCLMEIVREFDTLPADPHKAICESGSATVLLWDARGNRVYWGPPDQDGNPDGDLRSQTADSVLSLIRMVVNEGAQCP